MINRKALIQRLALIQRKLCAYDCYGFRKEEIGPPDMCDCKFGLRDLNDLTGEENGCPEMRQVVWLLERMSDEEYNNLLNV